MSVKLPKVAILLAAYNGMQWIEEQLSSILGQAGVELSVYISVDPSTDNTEAWIESYAAKIDHVVVLPAGGIFGGASRNFFRLIRDVDISGFDFIAFADQDDIWHSDKLERAVAKIESQKVDAYSSNVIAFWHDGKTCVLNKAQPQVKWDYLFEAAGPGCTYVFRESLARSLKNAVVENWSALQQVSLHDWFCYAFARSHGYRWYIDPIPSMQYRQHLNNQVGANTGLSSLVSRYKTIHDGWWFSQVQLIARLVGGDSYQFVKSWMPLRQGNLLKLSFSAWQCRRRVRDKVLFFFICWTTALIGKKTNDGA